MKPLPHQEKFVSNYTGKKILAWECGTGKTIAGCLWLKDNREHGALVVCPKRVVKKWEQELVKWGTKALVLSKEDFKKYPLKAWKSIIIDEGDWFASPLFSKGRSKLTEQMYKIIKTFNPEVLILTATPVRSNPWNLHTLLTLSGNYIDWKKWREHFFELKKMPYMPRPAYMTKTNWRKLIKPFIEKYCDIVLLKDCVDYLPPITEYKIPVIVETFTPTEWEGKGAFNELHRHEQKNKVKHILEIAREYRKVLVVAYYTEHINELKKELSKDREVFVLSGSTKDQAQTIKDAHESDECFFIVQNSVGDGWDGDSFSCVVFTSMSWAVRDYIQIKSRVRRIHNLHPVAYYFLLGGQCDKKVFNNIRMGKDFVPSEFKYEPTRPTKTI